MLCSHRNTYSDFIPPFAGISIVPFLCSYQLWTDEKHLAEYLSWVISGLPPPCQCLLGIEFPLHAENQRALKNAVATHHHFSTVCAEKSILVITVTLL